MIATLITTSQIQGTKTNPLNEVHSCFMLMLSTTNQQTKKTRYPSTAQKSRILWSFERCTRPSWWARNIRPTKRKTKNIEQTKPINQPTNPKDNKILPFERCPRPSYWAPPVPQTPRSPLCLRSSYLPLPVKRLLTHFTHLKRIFEAQCLWGRIFS